MKKALLAVVIPLAVIPSSVNGKWFFPKPSPPTCTPNQNPSTLTSSQYDFEFVFTNVPVGTSQDMFTTAANRWREVIFGDVSDIASSNVPSNCGALTGAIDDIRMCANYAAIDGVGKILGSAGPLAQRSAGVNAPLTFAGQMRFDIADVGRPDLPRIIVSQKSCMCMCVHEYTSNGRLTDSHDSLDRSRPMQLHEMGHIVSCAEFKCITDLFSWSNLTRLFILQLGIGTLWKDLGLITSTTPPCFHKATSKASNEYQCLSGCPSTSAIPIEKNVGSSGSDCSHWAESCLKNELMTPFASGSSALSRMTIASLEDIGYVVNYAGADDFALTDLDQSCRCTGRRRLSDFPFDAPVKERKLQEPSEAQNIAREAAVVYGIQMLLDRQSEAANFDGGDEWIYIGDRQITIIYEDPDTLAAVSVDVRNEH
jgi:hypothetical protein